MGTLLLRSETNPDELYALVLFESEEKARANEQTSKHQEIVGQFESVGASGIEYLDLTLVEESSR